MKVYELMARLEKLPSGAEVICSGIKTVEDLEKSDPIGNHEYGNKEYSISENIVDVDLESNHVYLQF